MAFRRLFFDIEVSYCKGWFWSPSYNTSISYNQILEHSKVICICWKWQGSNKIHHLEWDSNQDDKTMILAFKKAMLEADEIIGHNGDRYDVKWFRTRCLFHGVKSLPQFKTLDTLKISRSKFKFPSNKLGDIADYLSLGHKIDTGGIDLWHDVILHKKKRAMRDMVKYCKMDVELLEKIFHKLEGYAPHKTHVGLQENGLGADRCDCPYCGDEHTHLNRRNITPSGTISIIMRCAKCVKYFKVSNRAYINRKNG